MKERERETAMETTLNYFSLLGVTEDASQEEIEARYRELADYFASSAIPPSLREWAATEAALLDEAYAVLADPDQRAALVQSPAAVPAKGVPLPEKASQERDVVSETAPEIRPSAEPAGAAAPAAEERPQSISAFSAILSGIPWKPLALGIAAGVVALAAIIVGREAIDGIGGSGETSATTQTNDIVSLDTERIAELMTQAQQDPNNKDVLFELGETYFLAQQWQPGIDWFTKFLALDPNNIHARTDVGTAQFNLGRFEEAKAAWLFVLQVDPNDVQAHYNLGFLYANAEPVDLASAQAEWQKVVELAPESELAQTVQVHLQGLVDQPPVEQTPAEQPPEATPAPAAEP